MAEIFLALIVVTSAAHLVRPLGLPWLKKRSDFWRIGPLAFGIWLLATLARDIAAALL